MLAAPLADELGQTRRGDRIGDDREPGLLVEQHGAHQRDQPVAVDLEPRLIHQRHAVAIRVENDAQIRRVLQHRLAQGANRLLVLRVRAVVGEIAIRLQKLAAFRPGAQILEQLRIKAARAVAGVHHHMQPEQRPADRIVQLLLHELA